MYQKEINIDNILAEEICESSLDVSNYSKIELQEHLDDYFRFFGKEDMDIVYLYFLSEKRQFDLSEIFEKTQPAISYDVNRLRKQIDFIMYIVSVFDETIDFLSDKNNGLTPKESELLTVFFFSTSFTKTSKITGIQQVTVRCQINRIIENLQKNGNDKIFEVFNYINSNLNKVKKTVEKN